MSGHSKWATIKHRKGAADAKRAANFTKLAREIEVAARAKGPDPEMNFQLRLAIDKARAGNMPKDNIERAIARGAGTDSDVQMESLTYEAYAPGGTALIIECITDNRNRTGGDMKHLLSKNGGVLAMQGAVTFLFDQKGIVRTSLFPESKRDAFELQLIETGAEDFIHEEEQSVIVCGVSDLAFINDTAQSLGLSVAAAGIEWIPKTTVEIDEATAEQVEKLIQILDDLDDVTHVYTNAA